MGIRPNFTRDEIQKRMDMALAAIEEKQIESLMRLGEECLTEARRSKTYTMQTGALLSSTGYMIFQDGVAIHNRFDAASGAESAAASKGIKTGQTLAEAIGKKTKGVALVVVAGMEYAEYVEAKGYNVLSTANHLAQQRLPEVLQKLIDNINRAAQ